MENKSTPIRLRVTPKQHKELVRQAKKHKMRLSEYIRSKLFEK